MNLRQTTTQIDSKSGDVIVLNVLTEDIELVNYYWAPKSSDTNLDSKLLFCLTGLPTGVSSTAPAAAASPHRAGSGTRRRQAQDQFQEEQCPDRGWQAVPRGR